MKKTAVVAHKRGEPRVDRNGVPMSSTSGRRQARQYTPAEHDAYWQRKGQILDALDSGMDEVEVSKVFRVRLSTVKKYARAGFMKAAALTRRDFYIKQGQFAERLAPRILLAIERGLESNEDYNVGRIGIQAAKGIGMMKSEEAVSVHNNNFIVANMTEKELDRVIAQSLKAGFDPSRAIAATVESGDGAQGEPGGAGPDQAGCAVVAEERDEDIQSPLAGAGV